MDSGRWIAAVWVGVLSVVLGAAATSGAEPDAAGDGPHLFVVSKADSAQVAALSASSARVVARYESFDLVEADGADADALAGSGADPRDDMRKLTVDGSTFDPTEQPPLVGKEDGPKTAGFALVQFVGPPKDAWLDALAATGVRVVSYMAQNGYLVQGSAPQLQAAGELVGSDPAVRAAVPFTAADKIAAGVRDSGAQRLAVQTLTGADGSAARAELADADSVLRDPSTVGAFRTQHVRIGTAEAATLARDPGVIAVLPDARPVTLDERQDQILAGDLVGTGPAGPGYLAFLAGLPLGTGTFPFTVDVTDSGLDTGAVNTTHPDFHEGGVLANPSRVSYVNNYTLASDGRDCTGHGTLTAGIIAGYNDDTGATFEDAQGFNYGLGIAPRVPVGASKIFDCGGAGPLSASYTGLTTAAYNGGARISSNSWGILIGGGVYNADSQEYDTLVRDADPGTSGNQEMVEVFAAGNEGPQARTVTPPGTAKNVITVGGTEGVRPIGTGVCSTGDDDDYRDIYHFSGRGPTADLRRKPDLVAPGTRITGPQPQPPGFASAAGCGPFPAGSTRYQMSVGTSFAAPAVSGMAALLRQWYDQTMGPGIQVPSPALTKAILTQSSKDLTGGVGVGDRVPNSNQGWGLGDIRTTLSSVPRVYRDQVDTFGASGGSTTQTFAVQDPSKPVRVTLAWTDAPGPTVGNAFVNDLNLTVDAGGGAYRGNVFSGGLSALGGASDTRSNLESVYLPAGTDGGFTVAVAAQTVAGDGVPGNGDLTDQDFALVVSNAAVANVPVVRHETSTLTPLSPGDGDGVVEPGERFQLNETLRNRGTSGATGISGTLSGGGQVTYPDSAAAWPDLAVGAAGASSDPMAFHVSPAATCGAPVSVSIALTNAQGLPSSVPLTFATGAMAFSPDRFSTDVPKSILDNDASGVTSTVNVPDLGVVADVDLVLSSLTHAWDGDLKIDLTSPSGTTVNLVNRVGGAANSGDNFTNTMFDDEASSAIGFAGMPPYNGLFRPQFDQLSRFDGETQTGTWTLKVADLAAGNTGTLNSWGRAGQTRTCNFVPADATPPQTTIDSGSPGLITGDDPSFTFSSSEPGSSFECKLDAGAFSSCSSPRGYTDVAEGAHTFAVRAVDAGGNIDASPATQAFSVDATSPETTIDSGPAGLTGDNDPSFAFSSSEAPSTFECKLDDGAFSPCTSPQPFTDVSDGAHTFAVRAIDQAANPDASPATRDFTVDATTPLTTIDSGPSGLTASNDPSFTFSSSEPGSGFECKLDAGSFSSCASPRGYTDVADGAHTFSVRATDPAANTDAGPPTRSFTVDTKAGETTITKRPSKRTTKKKVKIEFTSSEAGSTFRCKLDKQAFATCASPFTAKVKPGKHTFQVLAVDSLGNADPTPAEARWKRKKPA